MTASLNEKLQQIEWGEYRLGALFEFEAIKQAKSQGDIPTDNTINGVPYIIQSTFNNMFSRNVNKKWLIENNEAPVSGNRIVLGVTLPAVSYQPREFGASQVITVKADWLNDKIGNFIVILISKLMYQFGYDRKPGVQIYKNLKIQLPIKNGKIDFEFMEDFISELEQVKVRELYLYLQATELQDCALTSGEERVLADFESGKVEWGNFKYSSIFNNITQGRRLKKDDQVEGDMPFVMSGVTNTGVVNYISNPITSFPKNSITVDIFGNTFYRSYDFSAGDDTGVYWNNERTYSKETMLFFTTSISKSLAGKFDFGSKLRSSQSFDFLAFVPTKNNQPDYAIMEIFISAIQKLVVRDMVDYVGRKMI